MKPGVMYHYVVLRGLVGRENFRLYWSPLKKELCKIMKKYPILKEKKIFFSFPNNHFIAKQIISKNFG